MIIKTPFRFDKIEFNHPIFQDIFSNDEKKNVESPEIYFHFNQKAGLNANEIISLIDGSSFLSDYKIGKGKVLLMNTAPVLSWSNFPIKSIFVPLMNKAVYYLSSKDRNENDFIAGSKISIRLPEISSPQLKIDKPDQTEEFINMEDSTNLNYLTYDKTNLIGNYKIYSNDKVIEEFSVNNNPLESSAEYLDNKQIKDYLKKIHFRGKHFVINKDQNPAEVVLQSRFGSELWKYFLLAALILALVEMTIARNSKKELITKE